MESIKPLTLSALFSRKKEIENMITNAERVGETQRFLKLPNKIIIFIGEFNSKGNEGMNLINITFLLWYFFPIIFIRAFPYKNGMANLFCII